jgi:hypothetical protein
MGDMRRAALPPALVALLLLAACSSHHSATQHPAASPVASVSAPATATAAPSATRTAAAPLPGTTRGPGPGRTPPPTAAATTAPGHAAPAKATPAGTYTYDSSGSQRTGAYSSRVTGTATLVMSALRAGRQSSSLHNAEGDTREELLVRDAGSYLSDLQVHAEGLPDKEFAFAKAVLLLPDPARVGMTWSWGGLSTDGKTTVRTDNKVVRTETVAIGGRAVRTVVVQTHLVLAGDIDYTADITTWVEPSVRLPVKDHTVGKGTALGVPFSFDVTDVLRSTRPA